MFNVHCYSAKGGRSTVSFDTPFVIEADYLASLVNQHSDVEIKNLARVFWEGDYMNDCYKSLWFRDGNELADYNTPEQLAVISFLDATIPKYYPYEHILVDVSW